MLHQTPYIFQPSTLQEVSFVVHLHSRFPSATTIEWNHPISLWWAFQPLSNCQGNTEFRIKGRTLASSEKLPSQRTRYPDSFVVEWHMSHKHTDSICKYLYFKCYSRPTSQHLISKTFPSSLFCVGLKPGLPSTFNLKKKAVAFLVLKLSCHSKATCWLLFLVTCLVQS